MSTTDLLPGILVQSVTFRASMTAIGLADDLKLGVIDRFRSMPMARSAVLVGRTAADLVRNVLIIVLMIIVGYIVGFRFQAGFAQALGCIALVSAFGLALSWIFAFVALTVRSAEAAQSAGFVVLFPLVFASSVFVPVSTLPGWLEAIAKVSPVSLTANAARSLALTPGTPSSLGGAIAWVGAGSSRSTSLMASARGSPISSPALRPSMAVCRMCPSSSRTSSLRSTSAWSSLQTPARSGRSALCVSPSSPTSTCSSPTAVPIPPRLRRSRTPVSTS